MNDAESERDRPGVLPTAPALRPRAPTFGWANAGGLIPALGALAACRAAGSEAVVTAMVVPAVAAGTFVGLETALRGWLLARPAPRSGDQLRVLVKLLGLAVTMASLGLAYWLLPEYRGDFYRPFFGALRSVGPWLAVAAVPYFAFVDRRMEEPCDGYWVTGCLVLGLWERVRSATLRQHALGWLVKGFFLPLMFVDLVDDAGWFIRVPLDDAGRDATSCYDFSFRLLYMIDLLFAVVGYAMTLRAVDAHIRSSDATLLGWMAALICYQPFWSLFGAQYLAYEDDFGWGAWLAGWPLLQGGWGALILACVGVYAWATVTFGVRFSNLTHRGILTNGPYRFTKHPAYLAKNLSWWLIAVPFVSRGSWQEALRHCLLLLGLNFVYVLRAWTEERHLVADPTYVAYALWIEEHGVLRALGRRFSWLRFSEIHRRRLCDHVASRPPDCS
jgi:protein-S-isoprenylcysteine O-methyltransferase Ste14